MTVPPDPNEPGQPQDHPKRPGQQPPHGQPPGEPPSEQPPYAWTPPPRYPDSSPPQGFGPMPPAPSAPGPPGVPVKRPGTVLAAMVLWIIIGVVSLLVAAALLAAAGNEAFHRRVVIQLGTQIASSALLGVGVLTVIIGLAYIVLAVAMSRARNWARIAISVLGVLGLILLFGLNILMFVLVAVAIVLQFLPASNNYFAAAKQVR